MRKWLAGTSTCLAAYVALLGSSLAAPPPKLLVVLVVDQMRADYVDWYGKSWRGGLKRLFGTGADFRNAAYPYLQTVTCAGHATIGTGTYPYQHGMVQNAWYDRASAQIVSCTNDDKSPLVSYSAPVPGGDSAQRLAVPTLADEMRAQIGPLPKVVTLALKARSAIALAGHGSDATTWFTAGGFVTSRAYSDKPVDAVRRALDKLPLTPPHFATWKPLLPDKVYLHQDAAPEESPPKGWTRSFPHAIKADTDGESVSNWARSPMADEYVAQVSLELVKSLALGKDAAPDFLGVSFSVLDVVGHAFGPRSHEVQDVLARLDVTLGRLLAGLDAAVGKANYVVALTADHGVAPFPEQVASMGLPAGRVPMERVKSELEAAVGRELGGAKHVASVLYTDLYLAAGSYEKLLAKPGAIERVMASVKKVPGVAAVFHGQQLLQKNANESSIRQTAALSYHPERSGDLVLVPAPHWMTVEAGTTHGTSNDYDQRVPLVIVGPGIKAARHHRRVSPADIAPTLGRMVGVTLPKADGELLPEALVP